MTECYKDARYDIMDRTNIAIRLEAITGKGKGSGNRNRNRRNGRNRGNANRGYQGNGNQGDQEWNWCRNEGVNGGECERFNKYGSHAINGCKYRHKFGRDNRKRTAAAADLPQLKR